MLKLPPNPITAELADDIDNDVVKTVSIALPCAPCRQIAMRITWDSFGPLSREAREKAEGELHGVSISGCGRRPDSTRLIDLADEKEATPMCVEEWLVQAAWALGAGYLYRWHWAARGMTDALRRDFGDPLYVTSFGGEETPFARGERSDELAQLAANHGYWAWEFNSAYRKYDGHSAFQWSNWRKNDPSIEDNGGRSIPFPGWRDDKWLKIAKQFEESGDPGLTLRITYNLTTLRMDPHMP